MSDKVLQDAEDRIKAYKRHLTQYGIEPRPCEIATLDRVLRDIEAAKVAIVRVDSAPTWWNEFRVTRKYTRVLQGLRYVERKYIGPELRRFKSEQP